MSADDKIRFRCHLCRKAVSVARAHAGKSGKCPACGQTLQIPELEPDFDILCGRSIEELKIKTVAHEGIWEISRAAWDIDQDAGTIVFTSPKGITATCAVQIIGTYNTDDGTWLWGWDHPSVDPALQTHAELCRDYGERHAIESLRTQKIACGEDDAWQLTAFACKLADAQGAYCGTMGTTLVFVTFGAPRLTKS